MGAGCTLDVFYCAGMVRRCWLTRNLELSRKRRKGNKIDYRSCIGWRSGKSRQA